MPRMWLNSWANTDIPELSAWVEEPPPALGQMDDPEAQEVHSTYRVRLKFGSKGSGGPTSSVTSSLLGNFIGPNSCHVEDSSCPALRKKTKSKPAGISGPTALTQAARPSVRMFLLHESPA